MSEEGIYTAGLEVIYKGPIDAEREQSLIQISREFGGTLQHHEPPSSFHSTAVTLTFDFPTYEIANNAADAFRANGEHVEGPFSW
jgi:hypothetical protein